MSQEPADLIDRVASRLWAPGRLWAMGCGLLLTMTSVRTGSAQDSLPPRPPPADTVGTLNLFLDCRAPGCDFNYLRTQLTWVNYVRDRTAAQVHVIVTALGTGSGGNQVTLEFIGAREFAGVDDEVKYDTQRGASGDELRAELTRVLKLGPGAATCCGPGSAATWSSATWRPGRELHRSRTPGIPGTTGCSASDSAGH